MEPPEKPVRISRRELQQMTPEMRIRLFGYDPLKREESFLHKRTLMLTLALCGLIIGGTLFFVEFVMRPGISPKIDKTSFVIPETESINHQSEAFSELSSLWLSGDFKSFPEAADEFMTELNPQTDTAAIKEIQLYKIRALWLSKQYDSAENLIIALMSRYPGDPQFLSDLYYYRGHIITQKTDIIDAYYAFAEAQALGGRYADESGQIVERIEKLSRSLW